MHRRDVPVSTDLGHCVSARAYFRRAIQENVVFGSEVGDTDSARIVIALVAPVVIESVNTCPSPAIITNNLGLCALSLRTMYIGTMHIRTIERAVAVIVGSLPLR